jgi:hypothetical protein
MDDNYSNFNSEKDELQADTNPWKPFPVEAEKQNFLN